MIENIVTLKEACSLIKPDSGGVLWKGNFVSLSTDFHITAIKDKKHRIQNILFKYIIQDIWNMGTIIHRLAWFRERAITDKFISNMWLPYASVDIEHFHTEFRSIMDYSAEIIAHASNKKGQVPQSFRKLIQWLPKKPGNKTKIGEDLASVVESAGWFSDFRGVRDALIHSGAFTLVYGDPKDGILFQIHKGLTKSLISHDLLMFNENVAYFERYAAMYLSHLLIFLERLAAALKEKYKIKPFGKDSSCSSPGFSIILEWMQSLLNLIEKQMANKANSADGKSHADTVNRTIKLRLLALPTVPVSTAVICKGIYEKI